MSLVTLASLTAKSTLDPTQTLAERALARIQDSARPMPPLPNAPATPLEAQGLRAWIAAGYPAGTCSTTNTGGAPGTMMGTGGATARPATGGAGGMAGPMNGGGGITGAVAAAGLPCDVQAVLQSCTSCHSSPPLVNVPMPLLTRANLMAPSAVSATVTFAQRSVTRMQDTLSPMPPIPGTLKMAMEIATVNNWIAAGYPAGTCGVTGAGGAGGSGGPPPPNPFAAAAKCTSNTFWTGGNNGNPVMNPGRACIACHANGGGGDDDGNAPRFTIAGTVYPSAHEPDLCNGTNGTTGTQIVIVDAANRTTTLTPNAAGNFYTLAAIARPFHVKVVFQGRERIMTAAPTTGDCNSCHTQNGASSAPGRILLP